MLAVVFYSVFSPLATVMNRLLLTSADDLDGRSLCHPAPPSPYDFTTLMRLPLFLTWVQQFVILFTTLCVVALAPCFKRVALCDDLNSAMPSPLQSVSYRVAMVVHFFSRPPLLSAGGAVVCWPNRIWKLLP